MSPYTSNEAKPTPSMITGESVRLIEIRKSDQKDIKHVWGKSPRERRGGQACLSSTGKSGDLGQPAQVVSLEWTERPGARSTLAAGVSEQRALGQKRLQDSGGTEFLEFLYTSTVPSETLLHISNAPAWSRILDASPRTPVWAASRRTGTESGRGVAG